MNLINGVCIVAEGAFKWKDFRTVRKYLNHAVIQRAHLLALSTKQRFLKIATTITLTSTETEIWSGYSLFIVHLGKLRKNSLSINYEFNSTSKSTPNAKFTNPKITREKSKQF